MGTRLGKQSTIPVLAEFISKTFEGSYYHSFTPSLVNLGVPESSGERTNNLLEKVLHNQEKINKLGAEPNTLRATTASVPIATVLTPENVLPLQPTTEIQSALRQRPSRIPRADDNRERVLKPATRRMVLKETLKRKDI